MGNITIILVIAFLLVSAFGLGLTLYSMIKDEKRYGK